MAKLSDGASNGRQDFPIVGIGASAGGLAAIERFMRAAPSDANFAYVVVQHLDPDHESMLPELISRFTPMPVSAAEDRTAIESNHVYTAPPGKDIAVLGGVLRVSDRPPCAGVRMPIDDFLCSLAEDRAEMAVGVILSGTGSDGTRGLRAIRERSGLALAQEPSTAQFDGMPRSAIDEGLVDIVAPPEELPAKMLEHRLRAPLISNAELPFAASPKAIERIIALLRSRSGNDFSLYKKSTLHRRIERRMGIHGIPSIDAYVSLVQRNPVELDLLFKELLIGVTSFFRDARSWEALSSLVARPLLERTKGGRCLRAWSAGCSTGEEAYSLAIAFREAGAGSGGGPHPAVKIFATDLDGDVVAKARQGYFPESATTDLPGDLREKYFVQEDGGFRVRKEIREMVVFAPHNLLSDPPFTKLDLVCCRNLLVYLTQEQQRRIIPLIHYSLDPGGFLFLGNAESIGCFTDLFIPIDKDNRIYRKIGAPRPSAAPSPGADAPRPSAEARERSKAASEGIREAVDRVLLESFVPAALLTRPTGEILYVKGSVNEYVEIPAGKASLNILAMAKKKLRDKLEIAFAKALRSGEPCFWRSVEMEGGKRFVDLDVRRLDEPDELKGSFLVVIAEARPPGRTEAAASDGGSAELESALAEANDELQSANEELQSTNEELMTSREEMQSLNEELRTVNAELQARIEDLVAVGDDVRELLDSTDISMIILDERLRVRRFTKRASELTRLIPADIGRVVTDIATDLIYPELADDAVKAFRETVAIEREVRSKDGSWFVSRVMPHRTRDKAIDGAVIVFTEISRLKLLEAEIEKARVPERGPGRD
jgi:chemotaxis methyl-accepting protein methylase